MPAADQDQQIEMKVTNNFIEVTSSAPNKWVLQYSRVEFAGFQPNSFDPDEAHLVISGSDRAFFSHGCWMRWIDTKRGIVIGRWRFPGEITNMVVEGSILKVQVTDKYDDHHAFTQIVDFDPRNPATPPGVAQMLILLRIPAVEFLHPFFSPYLPKGISNSGFYTLQKFPTPAQSKALIPQLESVVRHDSLSPWLQILYAVTLAHADDPRAAAALDRALKTPSDYTEWLPISAFLEKFSTSSAADAAFELGYSDLIRRGIDPRLFGGIIQRLLLYPVDFNEANPTRRRVLVEHVYRLNPYTESSALAWTSFARAAATPEERNLWRERAAKSSANTPHVFADFAHQLDLGLLFCGASLYLTPLFLIISYVRHRPQRRADLRRLKENCAPFWKRLTLLNVQYWSMSQRIGIVLITLLSTFVVGTLKQASVGITREGVLPMSVVSGDYSGPVAQWFLQNKLPDVPERLSPRVRGPAKRRSRKRSAAISARYISGGLEQYRCNSPRARQGIRCGCRVSARAEARPDAPGSDLQPPRCDPRRRFRRVGSSS